MARPVEAGGTGHRMLRGNLLAHAAPGDVAFVDVRPRMVIFKHKFLRIHAEISAVDVPHREDISVHGEVPRHEGADIARFVFL